MMPGFDIGGIGPTRGFSGLGGSDGGTHPFLLINASESGTAKVRVYSGLVNALDPVADGPFSTADSPAFLVTVTDGQTVYLDITLSYDSATGVWSYTSYNVAAGASLPSATSTHAYILLGTVAVASGDVTAIAPGASGNIGHERCGDSTTYSDKWWAGPTA